MMKRKDILALAAACLLSAGAVSAQTAMPSLRAEQDPVPAGMGFAGLASTSGTAYSALRNSSVIPFSERKMDFGASYQSWAPDRANNANMALGASFKLGKRFGLSLAGVMQNSNEGYTIIDASGNAGGTFKPSTVSAALGFGVRLMDALAAGDNLRYASQKLTEDDSYSALCADLFVTYRVSGFNVAAGATSLGGGVEGADGKRYSLPSSARVGLDWAKGLAEVHSLRLDADFDYFFCGDITVAAGVQYSFKDMFFARAGYHYGAETAVLPSFATAGLGVKLAGVELNMAYLFASEPLGGTMTFGLGYSF